MNAVQPMLCANCDEPLEAGAAFCGNCGQAIAIPANEPTLPRANDVGMPQAAVTPPLAQLWDRGSKSVPPEAMATGSFAVAGAANNLPAYAVPIVGQQTSEMKAGMSAVLGILGLVGAFFIPLLGIGLGVGGLVLATIARHTTRHRLSMVGIILSTIAITAGLASWAFVIAHDPRFSHKTVPPAATKTGGTVVTAENLITPCYSVTFASRLNIQNNSGSCNMNAFNGATLDASSDAYKIYSTDSAITSTGFNGLAKEAIDNDIHQNLPTFTINQEGTSQFASSPAYFVAASNRDGVSLVEEAVLHKTTNGDNFFVFLHAVNAAHADLNELQAGWHWE